MQRVLIADDHEVTRRGIREIMRDAYPKIEVDEASSVDEVIALTAKRTWDLILLDILMPGGNAVVALEAIRKHDPQVPVLILTALKEAEYVVQTMQAGANGFMRKDRASEDLVIAIRRVTSGERYVDPDSAASLTEILDRKNAARPHDRLSEREMSIFRLIALGKSVKEIAHELHLSDKTVATHISRIREKTQLNSYVEIARYALQNGLVE